MYIKKIFSTMLLLVLSAVYVHADILDNHRIRKANQYLLHGNVEKADTLYQQIHTKKPFIVYDRGLLEYAKGNTDNARDMFTMNKRYAESTHDKMTMSKNDYNIGTMYLEQGDLTNAIDYYIKALKNNPKDRDAKYNLELARIMQKLRPEARKQQQKEQNKDKNKDQKDKKKEQKKKQAEQILNSFKQKEQQDMQRRSQGSGKKHVEKDW